MKSAGLVGTNDYWNWSSLREIDEATGSTKGDAFRAFKRLLAGLTENVDFVVMDHRIDDGLAARWHSADRLYRSSITPVLLSPDAAKRVADELILSTLR